MKWHSSPRKGRKTHRGREHHYGSLGSFEYEDDFDDGDLERFAPSFDEPELDHEFDFTRWRDELIARTDNRRRMRARDLRKGVLREARRLDRSG